MPSTLFPLVRLVAMENILVFKEIEQCFQILICCVRSDRFHKKYKIFHDLLAKHSSIYHTSISYIMKKIYIYV